MIVCGTAGTGKTYLISAAKQVLGTQCIVTATTGIAAFSINGQTLHSAAQLPIIYIGICRVTCYSGYS
jgi:ATP-dependent DNA helicase PIF1